MIVNLIASFGWTLLVALVLLGVGLLFAEFGPVALAGIVAFCLVWSLIFRGIKKL